MTTANYLRRSIAFAFLSILAVATSASAECAWVLWVEEEATEHARVVRHVWLLRQAYPTLIECKSQMARNIKRSVESWKPSTSKAQVSQSEAGYHIWSGDRLTTVEFRCVPDTVDPRGPKGQ